MILIKDLKKTNQRKKHELFEDFHTVGIINMDGIQMVQLNYLWNILYLVANLVFFQNFDEYGTALKEWLITNNGHHDAVITPNYMQVAIMTHFARMQQIDQFLSLLN